MALFYQTEDWAFRGLTQGFVKNIFPETELHMWR